MSAIVIDRDPHEKAAEDGNVVVLPRTNELQIDIDSPPDSPAAALAVERINEVLGAFAINGSIAFKLRYTTSPGGHLHVYVELYEIHQDGHEPPVPVLPLSCTMRIALQAACGSDGVREVLALVRVLRGHEAVNKTITCFFERPETISRETREAIA